MIADFIGSLNKKLNRIHRYYKLYSFDIALKVITTFPTTVYKFKIHKPNLSIAAQKTNYLPFSYYPN